MFHLLSLFVVLTPSGCCCRATSRRSCWPPVPARALAVVLFARRMDVVDHEGHPIDLGWRALCSYWPWLLKEIVKSAWDVTPDHLDPRLPISPTLVRFRPSQTTDVGLVIHANSITLTPGTITIEAGTREFLVHGADARGGARARRQRDGPARHARCEGKR